MKITAVESLQWAAYPRDLYVRIHTYTGIIGAEMLLAGT